MNGFVDGRNGFGRGRGVAKASKADEAVTAVVDVRVDPPDTGLSDRGAKWPKAFRLLFITAVALVLWALVFYAIFYLF